MSAVEPKEYIILKETIDSFFANYTLSYKRDSIVGNPYNFSYEFSLNHSSWQIKTDPLVFLDPISTAFIVNSTIKFEFYYTKSVETLSNVYSMRIVIKHLIEEYKQTFVYTDFVELMKTFKEIFDIFKVDIIACNTEHFELSINNFKNYCTLSQL